MKRCPYCGATFADDVVECPNDHTQLVSDSVTTAPAPAVAPMQPVSLALPIASLILGILAVVLSFLLIGAALGLTGIILGWVHLSKKRSPRRMAAWGLGLSAFGLIASLCFGALYYAGYKQFMKAMVADSNSENDLTKWEGVKAPDFAMTTLDGKTLHLSDFKGKRVVIDFWATWCPPCRQEIPHFIKLYNETSRDKLVIIGVSDEAQATLKKFVHDNGVNYPIANGKDLPSPYKDIAAIPATFYIDTKGTIQTIGVGYHEFSDIKTEALAEDFKGKVLDAPPAPKPMSNAPVQLKPVQLWSTNISGANAICTGQWLGNGETQILIAAGKTLHVLNLDGHEAATVSLPEPFRMIECGRNKTQGARLLGYNNWGRSVTVLDKHGAQLWNVGSFGGVDGAHWGDLDGDGTDELIAGMNGSGGLKAFSSEGKELWSVDIGNVWNQAVISATSNQPATVLATEAGGTVNVYDASGKSLKSLKPDGGYYAQMSACRTPQGIQIAAIDHDKTVVFDTNGKVLWTGSAVANPGSWRNESFATGDVDGDGQSEWLLIDGSGTLVVANTRGEKMTTIPTSNKIDAFTVVRRPEKSGVVVTLSHHTVAAYDLQR